MHYFTREEETVVRLLTELGIPKNAAAVLVFFTRTQEATSRTIEHKTGLRQPEISLAVKHLAGRGWLTSRAAPSEQAGRRKKVYELARPLSEIVDAIEQKKIKEIDHRLSRLKKLRYYL